MVIGLNLLGVGISETIRTQKNKIKNKIKLNITTIGQGIQKMSTMTLKSHPP